MSDGRSGVLVFGLGEMGGRIAARLLGAGREVTGCDPSEMACERLRAAGGRVVDAASVPDAMGRCAVVLTCVSDEAALIALWFGVESALGRRREGGLIDMLAPGMLVIDHTTTSIAQARRLAGACAARGAHWVDAPLSGGVARASAGELSAMIGGAAGAVAAARPWLAAYCVSTAHLGNAGAGQAGKLANQLAIAGTGLGLAAAVGFARGHGLDVAALLGVLGEGSARSDQLSQHGAALARVTEVPVQAQRRAPGATFEQGQAHADPLSVFAWLAKDMQLALGDAGLLDPRTCAAIEQLARAFQSAATLETS